MACLDTLKFKVKPVQLDNGVKREEIHHIVQAFSGILGSVYTLAIKTQNFHWNVVGPMFHSLHEISEEQYKDLLTEIDDIAERIRALGHPVPSSYAWLSKVSEVPDGEEIKDAFETIQQLVTDRDTIIKQYRSAFDIAERAKDQASCDFIGTMLYEHEKAAWMMRSHLG